MSSYAPGRAEQFAEVRALGEGAGQMGGVGGGGDPAPGVDQTGGAGQAPQQRQDGRLEVPQVDIGGGHSGEPAPQHDRFGQGQAVLVGAEVVDVRSGHRPAPGVAGQREPVPVCVVGVRRLAGIEVEEERAYVTVGARLPPLQPGGYVGQQAGGRDETHPGDQFLAGEVQMQSGAERGEVGAGGPPVLRGRPVEQGFGVGAGGGDGLEDGLQRTADLRGHPCLRLRVVEGGEPGAPAHGVLQRTGTGRGAVRG
jgi:hypothetical protein